MTLPTKASKAVSHCGISQPKVGKRKDSYLTNSDVNAKSICKGPILSQGFVSAFQESKKVFLDETILPVPRVEPPRRFTESKPKTPRGVGTQNHPSHGDPHALNPIPVVVFCFCLFWGLMLPACPPKLTTHHRAILTPTYLLRYI